MSYVIKLETDRFETLQMEPEFAQYIGISSLDGVRFPTNAFPFVFNDKESAEKYLSKNISCRLLKTATVGEFNAS